MKITQQEWDKIWWEQFADLRRANATVDLVVLQKAANTYMEKRYGARPPAEKVAGPPWWMPMGLLTKFWEFMNGKKVVVGAIITFLTVVAGYLPAVLAFFGIGAVQVAQYVGIATTVVGIAHKIYKFIYKEEHP
jgi:hypothetical protein